MNLKNLRDALIGHPEHEILIQLPEGKTLAAHFHVTEVGQVTKDFMDCGGKRRTTHSCRLQTLVANDVDHRLSSDKLAGILTKTAEALQLDEELPVEAEIQTDTISIYTMASFDVQAGVIRLTAASTKTACLAPDACRLDVLPVLGDDCSGETGCC